MMVFFRWAKNAEGKRERAWFSAEMRIEGCGGNLRNPSPEEGVPIYSSDVIFVIHT